MAFAPSRADDEFLLAILRLRANGWTSGEIATAVNWKGAGVRIATNRVKHADLAESGENPAVVASFYGWT